MKIIIDLTDDQFEQLKPAINNGERICQWLIDVDNSEQEYFATDCGNRFEIYIPGDGNFSFCPFCGAKISSVFTVKRIDE